MSCPLRPFPHIARPTLPMHHAQRVRLPARIQIELHLQLIDIR